MEISLVGLKNSKETGVAGADEARRKAIRDKVTERGSWCCVDRLAPYFMVPGAKEKCVSPSSKIPKASKPERAEHQTNHGAF